jgi:hypothetical protein
MYSYMSQFFGGALDPTWPHAVLIAGSIVGGALVGLGVILEAPKIISMPVAAVFVGVVIEAACTLLLFGFDEGISSAQQAKIGALTADIGSANDTATTALKREEQTAKRAEDAENLASKTLQDNIALRDKMADRTVSSEGRATIKRLRGSGQQITVVMPTMREPGNQSQPR